MTKYAKQIAFMIIIVLTLIIVNTPKVFAYQAYIQTGSKKSSGSQGDPSVTVDDFDYDPGRRFTCKYNPGWGLNRIININAYDMQGRPIIPYTYESVVKFKAGTWVGINLREQKIGSWDVTIFEYKEIEKKYTCKYTVNEGEEEKYLGCTSSCTGTGKSKGSVCGSYTHTWYTYEGGEKTKHSEEKDKYDCYEKRPKNVTREKTVAYHYKFDPDKDCPEVEYYHLTSTASADVAKSVDGSELCDAESVKKSVATALQYVKSPSLQFEMINANDYDTDNLNVRIFDDNELMAKKNSSGAYEAEYDSVYEEDQYVSADTEHLRTKVPTKTVTEYIEQITKENYEKFLSRRYYTTYEYAPTKVCIDVRTSNVGYNTKYTINGNTTATNDCNGTGDNIKEIEHGETNDEYLNATTSVDEPVKYWHYFIPLNTTTSSFDSNDLGFFIKVTNRSGEALTQEECIGMLVDQPRSKGETSQVNYMDFISPLSPSGDVDAVEFRGDYTGESSGNSSFDMQLFTQKGYTCKFATTTKFNIEQKFYGEAKKDDDSLMIKGYGFYYRPINPNEPFPNSIASDSIWQGLYDEGNNKITAPNTEALLNDSFDEITYTTRNASIKEIRRITNTGEKYTSWKNMELDGTSQFISNLGLRARQNIKSYNLYSLGCGPDNLDWDGCK